MTAFVLAGGRGDRLGVLAARRAKPALPFGGRAHLLDFTLSNCSNSGIDRPAVLVQHLWRSVATVIEQRSSPIGSRPYILRPTAIGTNDQPSYRGTADAVRQHFWFAEQAGANSVLVLSGDHVYAMDYRELLAAHAASGADVTIGCTPVAAEEAHRFGLLELDRHGAVSAFIEKPQRPRSTLASMGIYAFRLDALRRLLASDAGTRDFGHDVIPSALSERLSVEGYRFDGYWRDVGTIEAYWQSSMELLDGEGIRLDDPRWPIGVTAGSPHGIRFGAQAQARSSTLVADCTIDGLVERSIVFPGAIVEAGATVRDSIVMSGARIGPDAFVERTIVDEEAIVGARARVGFGDVLVPNRDRPDLLSNGLNVVGTQAVIPAGMTIYRNTVIGPGVVDELRDLRSLPTGVSVGSNLQAKQPRPPLAS